MELSREETLEKVRQIVAEKLSTEVGNVLPDASFKDLGADSLDIVEMIMTFEEAFGVEIGDDDAERLVTVRDAAERIFKLMNA